MWEHTTPTYAVPDDQGHAAQGCCERCWAEAHRRVMFLGGSVVERYNEVLAEYAASRKPTP